MSCQNFDSRSEKKEDKRNENSKSWYENETSKADSLPIKKASMLLDESKLEMICKTSFDKIPAQENITVQNRELDIVKEKSGSGEEVDHGRLRPRPATPQADR